MSSLQQTRPGATGDVDHGVAAVSVMQATPIAETIEETMISLTAVIPATDPVTIGEALETAGTRRASKPLTESDASAIMSAETRATGVPGGVKGGPAAKAQSAIHTGIDVTLGDVLSDATMQLPSDKTVTPEDASKVQSAEARHTPTGEIPSGGVAATMQEAAAVNQAVGGGA